jgi:hypothetical protein
MHWLGLVCATMPTRRQAADILDRVPPRRWTADALGKHLRVTDVERATLHIYTISSFQTPKAEREKNRKEKHRLVEQARRRANGSKPREQSYSRTKPWEAAGFRCRRTWERHGKPVSQIRAQYSYYSPGHEFATSRTARGIRNGQNGHGTPATARLASRRKLPTSNRSHPMVSIGAVVASVSICGEMLSLGGSR